MRSLGHRQHLSRLGLFSPRKRFSLAALSSFTLHSNSFHGLKLNESNARNHGCRSRHRIFQVMAFDEDAFGASPLDNWGDNEGAGAAGDILSSSDDEENDGEFILNPLSDIDLPTVSVSSNDALTLTAHRLAMIGRGRKTHTMKLGILISSGLIAFLTMLVLFVDWCAWKIVRLPLVPFYLSCPFFISAALVSVAGYLSVPLLNDLKIHQVIWKEGPVGHSKKRATPTMGGLFFVPIGVGVAKYIAGFSSAEVSGAVVAILAFAMIGLVNDILTLNKNHNSRTAWMKIFLEVAVGALFSFWLDSTSISSPYDGLDGLASGSAALAFIGMSIAVLPICSELSILGASMAGACVGFLLHNRYRASVFMGDTGSLALGGALAAMAACTGMFFPLFISSGIFVLDASSVILQVLYSRTTKHFWGGGRRLFRMTPVHRHLELCGFKEPIIVAGAYVISGILALVAGYVGLISA